MENTHRRKVCFKVIVLKAEIEGHVCVVFLFMPKFESPPNTLLNSQMEAKREELFPPGET